jgi:hypothetical protein
MRSGILAANTLDQPSTVRARALANWRRLHLNDLVVASYTDKQLLVAGPLTPAASLAGERSRVRILQSAVEPVATWFSFRFGVSKND